MKPLYKLMHKLEKVWEITVPVKNTVKRSAVKLTTSRLSSTSSAQFHCCFC